MNEARYVPKLLDSIRRQSVGDWEILVADSGSTDGTLEVATAAGARVLPGDRKGPGEGRNRGARAATGDVFVFADADCVLPPDLLAAVLAALADPRVIGGATGFRPEEGTSLDRLLFRAANLYQRVMTEIGIPHNAGYCFFFRRTAFERLGGINEKMLLNETHDLALRSRAFGRFVMLPLSVTTSMRRFRTYGYARTIVKEYLASTITYYLTGRTPAERFRPKPAR
jgi:glycosyltransferase involved in cell wall biosynthesis